MSSCGINSRPAARTRRRRLPGRRRVLVRGLPDQGRPGDPAASRVPEQHRRSRRTDVMGIMMACLAPPNPGYPRPKGATPMRASLVPAYNQCTSPNRVHGPPDFPGNASNPDGSCNPPAQTSGQITVGTPDANGAAANSVGFVRLSVINGNPATTADEADVRYQVSITDVRCKPGAGACGAANAPRGRLLGPGAGQDRPADHRPLQRPLRGRHRAGHLVRRHGAVHGHGEHRRGLDLLDRHDRRRGAARRA